MTGAGVLISIIAVIVIIYVAAGCGLYIIRSRDKQIKGRRCPHRKPTFPYDELWKG